MTASIVRAYNFAYLRKIRGFFFFEIHQFVVPTALPNGCVANLQHTFIILHTHSSHMLMLVVRRDQKSNLSEKSSTRHFRIERVNRNGMTVLLSVFIYIDVRVYAFIQPRKITTIHTPDQITPQQRIPVQLETTISHSYTHVGASEWISAPHPHKSRTSVRPCARL